MFPLFSMYIACLDLTSPASKKQSRYIPILISDKMPISSLLYIKTFGAAVLNEVSADLRMFENVVAPNFSITNDYNLEEEVPKLAAIPFL